MDQAMDFCLRKAGLNSDGSLSFKEFKSLLRALRNSFDTKSRAHIVFALFDLDGTNTIDPEEFIGIYRFFAGHGPTKPELDEIWLKLDPMDHGEVTRKEFMRWLQYHAPAEFKQHAPPVEDSSSEASIGSAARRSRQMSHQMSQTTKVFRPAPGIMPRSLSAPTWTTTFHSHWNSRFPQFLKGQFSDPQTIPELDRFYNRYRGFAKHRAALRQPATPRQKFILSNQSQPEICPERARPGGFVRNRFGDNVLWDDRWQQNAAADKRRIASGTLMFRCPKPPPLLCLGRDAPEY